MITWTKGKQNMPYLNNSDTIWAVNCDMAKNQNPNKSNKGIVSKKIISGKNMAPIIINTCFRIRVEISTLLNQ